MQSCHEAVSSSAKAMLLRLLLPSVLLSCWQRQFVVTLRRFPFFARPTTPRALSQRPRLSHLAHTNHTLTFIRIQPPLQIIHFLRKEGPQSGGLDVSVVHKRRAACKLLKIDKPSRSLSTSEKGM